MKTRFGLLKVGDVFGVELFEKVEGGIRNLSDQEVQKNYIPGAHVWKVSQPKLIAVAARLKMREGVSADEAIDYVCMLAGVNVNQAERREVKRMMGVRDGLD